MAMTTRKTPKLPEPMVLTGIPYALYVALRDVYANRHKRMTYYDGTLEIMSPEYLHEHPSRRIGVFVNVLAEELDIDFEGISQTTMRVPGDGPTKGKGKEPDQRFYFANLHRILGKQSIRVGEGDSPQTYGSKWTIEEVPKAGCPSMQLWACLKSGGIGPGRIGFNSWPCARAAAMNRLSVA